MADIRIKDLATTAASTASDDFVAVDGSANGTRKLNAYSPTFGGNLTVSGTGTSSVAGNFGVGTTSPSTKLHVAGGARVQDSTSTSNYITLASGNEAPYGGNSIVAQTSSLIVGTVAAEPLILYTSATEQVRLTSGGTLLLKSDGVDSGNGKLQLAEHTAKAGGIGLGTDWSFHRISSSYLGMTTTNSTATLSIGNSTNPASTSTGVILQLSGNDAYVWNYHGGTFYIGNNNATAITINSSQNATFAGTKITLGQSTNPLLFINSNDAAGSASFVTLGNDGSYKWHLKAASQTDGNRFQIGKATGATTVSEYLGLDYSTGDATFAGTLTTAAPTSGTAKAWKLGEVATVSPTSPNRTIRVEIDGTVYYIAAKTTND